MDQDRIQQNEMSELRSVMINTQVKKLVAKHEVRSVRNITMFYQFYKMFYNFWRATYMNNLYIFNQSVYVKSEKWKV